MVASANLFQSSLDRRSDVFFSWDSSLCPSDSQSFLHWEHCHSLRFFLLLLFDSLWIGCHPDICWALPSPSVLRPFEHDRITQREPRQLLLSHQQQQVSACFLLPCHFFWHLQQWQFWPCIFRPISLLWKVVLQLFRRLLPPSFPVRPHSRPRFDPRR